MDTNGPGFAHAPSAFSSAEVDRTTEVGARHPSTVSVTAPPQQVRERIATELARIGRAARADYDRALASERSLAASFARLKTETNGSGQASVRLRELEREVEANRAADTAFLTRSREIRERSGINSANACMISRASPPQEKSWPMPGLFALCALAAGVGVGAGLAVVAEHAAPTVLSRGPRQRLARAQVVGVLADPATTRGRSQAGGAANARLILGRLLAGPGLLDVLRGNQALAPLLPPRRPGALQILDIGRDGRGEFVGIRDVRARLLSEIERRSDLVVIDGGSANARIEMIDLFARIPLRDLMFGPDTGLVDGLPRISGLEWGIENPVIRMVLYQGNFMTSLVAPAVVLFVAEMLRWSRGGTLLPTHAFAISIDTSESLAGKAPLLTKFAVLMLVLDRPLPRPASGRTR